MKTKDTYNIHKIIHCVFPKFKSKMLCRLGNHNYIIKYGKTKVYEVLYKSNLTGAKETTYIQKRGEPYFICRCCGKIEKWEE